MRLQALILASTIAMLAAHVTVATQRPAPPDVVRGQVVAADGNAPVANARVLRNSRPLTWTDASGRFEVTADRGSNPLQIEKAGFLTQTIKPAQDELIVRMARSAAVTVRIVNHSGEPVPWRVFRLAGPRAGIIAQTDDRGEQRLSGLVPSRYAADLEDLPAPLPVTASDAEAQAERRTEARTDTVDARRDAPELRGGEEGRITLTVPPPSSRSTRGAGTVRGRVAGPDAVPLRGARVSLRGQDSEITVETDAAGEYVFDGVSPGTYRLHAAAQGHARREFGQTALGIRGLELALKAGEQRQSVDVRLPRGGTVAGRVLDRRGEPYEAVPVLLVEQVRQKGSVREDFLGAGMDVTDEQGHFRISGVEPGNYYLVARPERRSEAPTFHPGALSLRQATRITLRGGEELTGVDVAIDWDRGTSISGILLDPDGKPMRSGTMSLERGGWVHEPVFVRQVPIGADGSFEFLGVAPGDYALFMGPGLALSIRIDFSGTAVPSRSRLRAPTAGATVVVGDTPVSLRLRASLMPNLSGRLIGEDGSALTSAASLELVTERGGARAVIRDDGTFDVANLSGTTRFTLGPSVRGWWLKSMVVGGVNVAETPATFVDARETRHGVAAVVARTGEISGRVLDANGQPAPQSSVVVFPVDREKWRAGGRYVRSAAAAATGEFVIEAPPGDYMIAAVHGRADTRDAALTRLASGADRVSLKAGETLRHDVRR